MASSVVSEVAIADPEVNNAPSANIVTVIMDEALLNGLNLEMVVIEFSPSGMNY
jgi:hypothetical protein